MPDFLEIDSDNDGVSDRVEAGLDPGVLEDSDRDGIPDYLDIDQDNDGVSDAESLSVGIPWFGGFLSDDSRFLVSSNTERGRLQVFLRDLATGVQERITTASDGRPGNGNSRGIGLSGNGIFVVFLSEADNLVSDDDNGRVDIFLWSRLTGRITGVTTDQSGSLPTFNGITSNGRYLLYWLDGLFLLDRDSGTSRLINRYRNGRISADGSTIVYSRRKDQHSSISLFAYDIATESEEEIRHSESTFVRELYLGQPGSQALSGDASKIIASYDAPVLRSGKVLFVMDRVSGITEQVNLTTDGRTNGFPFGSISPDGRFVAYVGRLSEDLPCQILLRDLVSKESRPVAPPQDCLLGTRFSGDGRYLDYSNNGVFRIDLSPFQDHDQDGLSNNLEGYVDTDGDGLEDYLDLDSDNNGVDDAAEAMSRIRPQDFDGDGIADFHDLDDDGDLLPDIWEQDNGLDRLNAGDAGEDNDGDGVSNLNEFLLGSGSNNEDSDGDELLDAMDNCPMESNPAQVDIDSDNVGDACDLELPRLLGILPDMNGNGVPEVTGLLKRRDFVQLRIRDASTGGVVATRGGAGTIGKSFVVLSGAGIGGGDAIAGANVNKNNNPFVPIIDLDSGEIMRVLNPRGSDWEFKDIAGLPSLAPSGADALMTLVERRVDGLIRLEVFDPRDKQQLSVVNPLTRYWTAHSIRTLNVNGQVAIGLFATRDSDGLTVVQVLDPLTGVVLNNVFPLDSAWTAKEFKSVPDLDGNGVDEVAVRMIDVNGQEIIQIRDALSGELISNVRPLASSNWQAQQFEFLRVSDKWAMAILSVRSRDRQVIVQTKNVLTGQLMSSSYFLGPPWVYQQGFQVIPDFTGNGADEIAVLLRNGVDSQRRVQVRDSDTSELIRNVYQPF